MPGIPHRPCFLLACLAAVSAVAAAADEETGSLLARHEHGRAAAAVTQQGLSLRVELAVPGHGTTGFEHPPGNPDEQARLEAVAAFLESGDWLEVPPDAACTTGRIRVFAAGFGPGVAQNGDGAPELPAGHAGLEAHIEMVCTRPRALTRLDFPIFGELDGLATLDTGFFTDRGQGREVLTPDDHRLVPGPP